MLKLKNRSSGLGQFCLHLGRALVAAADPRVQLGFYLPRADAGVFGAVPQNLHAGWHRLYCPWRGRADVWHATHQDARILPAAKTRLLVTVHDLNFEQKLSARGDERGVHSQARRLRQRLQRAAAIAAVSQHTADQLQRLQLDVPVTVIPNGLVPLVDPAIPAWAPREPFLLAIGVLHARKNFHVLPGMLAHLPDLRLVIAGQSRPYEQQIRAEVQRHGVADRVLLPGEVTDAEKSWLYHRCQALLVPSLAEGFGLPVLEAMSCGKPVVSSREGSLPEVGGEVARYWDGFEPEAMAGVVRAALASPPDAAAARARAARFSWTGAAAAYLELYATLAH